MELKGSKTEANLMTAFAGESQARNKYTYFASKAKKEGYVQIAANAKKRIREQLRLFGMPGELVYPELSNVCDELKIRFEEIKKGKSE